MAGAFRIDGGSTADIHIEIDNALSFKIFGPVWFPEAFQDIIGDERREIDWLFDTTRRNWVLIPSRSMEEKAHHRLATEAQAADLIAREDPEYKRRSVRDFDRIIDALDLVQPKS